MLAVADLEYELPESAIATTPAEPRDAARLLVISRSDPNRLEHRRVADLSDLLTPGDLLVVNRTRVVPARLLGRRGDTGGKVEGLFLGLAEEGSHGPAWSGPSGASPMTWRVLLKGRRMKAGIDIPLTDASGRETGVRLRLLHRLEHEGEDGAWCVEALGAGSGDSTLAVLEQIGTTPLPPYIRAARKRRAGAVGPEGEACGPGPLEPDDRARYQTVYAQSASGGSVAAPTAGLHFTPELLLRLQRLGVRRAEVTLHVGAGTFKPVETQFVEQHTMHAEWCEAPGSVGGAVAEARARGGRVIAVGTTTARTLESFAPEALARAEGVSGWSRLLITPGHAWRNLDGLLTNFHLPRSTLLAMVAALLEDPARPGGGVRRLLETYAHAIREGYRFYSFGDAMLILP